MDAKQFLSEFRHIASAPGGVQQVRELVIYMAIHGKFSKDSESDRKAAEQLIGEAAEIKRKTRIGGKSQREQQLPTIPESYTAMYPSTWALARLGSMVHLISGEHLSAEEQNRKGVGIPYLTGASDFGPLYPTVTRWTSASKAIAERGDILLAVKGTIGRINLLNLERAALGRQLMAVRALAIDPAFLALILRSNENYFLSQSRGIAIPGISRKHVLHLIIGFPSRDEQQRIVAKVDELMALCDRLEAQQQEREALCKLTRAAALDAITSAGDSLVLQEAWSRVQVNIDDLLDSEHAVMALADSLRKLAVHGHLSQWTYDPPPIGEIKAACTVLKHEHLRKKWLRKQQPVLSMTRDEGTYPPHWSVVPFDEVAVVVGGITKGRNLRGKDVRSYTYLRVANVQRGFFDLTDMKRTEVPVDEVAKYLVEEGDLLITEGGDWDKVGRTAIWRSEVPDCLHQNHVFKARVPSTQLLNEWVELVFNSEVGRDYFAEASKQTTNLASINMTQLRSFPLPIPPVSEQVAILQRVNYLLYICEKLERQKSDSQNIARSLAIAAVASITGIRIEEKEKMKVPKTELVSNLRIGVSPSNREQAPLAAILIRSNGELSAKVLWNMYGLEIDTFYQQLKTEMAKGWIVQPEVAYMREIEAS